MKKKEKENKRMLSFFTNSLMKIEYFQWRRN